MINFSTAGRAQTYGTAVLLSALLSPAVVVAQSSSRNGEGSYETRKHLTVAVTRFADARTALTAFIRRRAVRVQKQEETPEQLTADFTLPARELPRLDSLTAALGYVVENNMDAHDVASQAEDLRTSEQSTVARITTINKQLGLDTLGSDERATLRKELERANDRLAELRLELAGIANHAGQAYVTLKLYDEVSFPTGNRRISFVNMPGVEYGYLRLDNPKVGLTSAAYRGYALKYLFTRGKSYLNLAVYKPVGANVDDANFINELFIINFGQDFYPKNFGRGRRRYLNLYTSYQVGGFILNRNSDKGSEFIPNLNLGLGLELLKTRHILLDTKASYFVPLNDRSRDLRGILGQASFNFVF